MTTPAFDLKPGAANPPSAEQLQQLQDLLIQSGSAFKTALGNSVNDASISLDVLNENTVFCVSDGGQDGKITREKLVLSLNNLLSFTSTEDSLRWAVLLGTPGLNVVTIDALTGSALYFSGEVDKYEVPSTINNVYLDGISLFLGLPRLRRTYVESNPTYIVGGDVSNPQFPVDELEAFLVDLIDSGVYGGYLEINTLFTFFDRYTFPQWVGWTYCVELMNRYWTIVGMLVPTMVGYTQVSTNQDYYDLTGSGPQIFRSDSSGSVDELGNYLTSNPLVGFLDGTPILFAEANWPNVWNAFIETPGNGIPAALLYITKFQGNLYWNTYI